MLAGFFVDVLRIGGQLVVEAIKINALTASNQPLLVRPVEVEMPGPVIVYHVVPVPDPGQWGIHHDPASDPIAVLSGERIADHVANIVGNKGQLSTKAELLKHGCDVPSF